MENSVVPLTQPNRLPIASDDLFSTREDYNILFHSLLRNDSDPDGDPLTIVPDSIKIDPISTKDLTIEVDNASQLLKVPPNWNGFASFFYDISDGRGGIATAKASVYIDNLNDPPVTANNTIALDEDNTRTFTLADFPFSDPLEGNLFMAVEITALPTQGVIKFDGVPIPPNNSNGFYSRIYYSPAINEGRLTYTPDANYNGTDKFTFRVLDGGNPNGNSSLPAEMAIEIAPVNDPAVFFGPTESGIVEDTISTIFSDRYATDVDNSNDSWQPLTDTSLYGTFAINELGQLNYTLDNSNTAVNALNTGDFLIDSFVVSTIDGTSQTVTVKIYGNTDIIPIVGSDDRDKLDGTAGDDIINALGGNDRLFGDRGNDTLDGGAGNDRLFGGEGNDIVLGGEGKDRLAGGLGNDILTGGSESDTFIFSWGMGNDTIRDFGVFRSTDPTSERDRIDLSDFDTRYKALSFTTSGSDTIVTINGDRENSITLTNVNPTQLSRQDFIF